MKWSIAGLLMVGLVAALCATLLMSSFMAQLGKSVTVASTPAELDERPDEKYGHQRAEREHDGESFRKEEPEGDAKQRTTPTAVQPFADNADQDGAESGTGVAAG